MLKRFICLMRKWDVLNSGLRPQPWHHNSTTSLLLPPVNISKIRPPPAMILGSPAHSFALFFLFWWEPAKSFLFWHPPKTGQTSNKQPPIFDNMRIAPPPWPPICRFFTAALLEEFVDWGSSMHVQLNSMCTDDCRLLFLVELFAGTQNRTEQNRTPKKIR